MHITRLSLDDWGDALPSSGFEVFHTPSGLSIPRLGPLVMPASPKRRKREQVNSTFSELILDELGVDDSLTLFRTTCPTAFSDPRPFVWSDLSLDTAFTYMLAV